MRGTQFAELSVFVAVAEEMSFTKAARRLGLSNATLSQAVRALEERLGTRLLNRTTRSVALTDAGERLLTQLRPALDGFDAAIESVNAFRDRPAGHLRLTMSPAIAKFIVAPLLGRFLKQYPDITMEISIAPNANRGIRIDPRHICPRLDRALSCGPQETSRTLCGAVATAIRFNSTPIRT